MIVPLFSFSINVTYNIIVYFCCTTFRKSLVMSSYEGYEQKLAADTRGAVESSRIQMI